MPPKKSKRAAKAAPPAKEEQPAEPEPKEETSTQTTKAGTKRKKSTPTDEPSKSARRSGRGTPKSTPSQLQLLNFLLSKPAEELCRPDDESDDINSRGDIKTYSGSVMNPFEELLSAVVLSRPISHRLGLRTIRTIFNDPYNFNSAKAAQEAGGEKVHQAIWDARTQVSFSTTFLIRLTAHSFPA
jgi:hypothetical protein